MPNQSQDTAQDVGRNIVIIPSQDIIDEAISRSQFVKQLAREVGHQNRVQLSCRDGKWPHLPLYQFGLPGANLPKIDSLVADIAISTRKFTIKLVDYRVYCRTGILWMASRNNEALQNLHQRLLVQLSGLREHVVLPEHQPLFSSDSGSTADQRQMLGKWGYPTAMDEYLPSITIGDTDTATDILGDLPEGEISFKATQIAITELGPNGTCPSPITTFDLAD